MTTKDKPKAPPKVGDMTAVKSSMLSHWHYDKEAGRLTVRYASGGLYSYDNVAPETIEEFKAAKSLGSFMATKIRGLPHVRHEEKS